MARDVSAASELEGELAEVKADLAEVRAELAREKDRCRALQTIALAAMGQLDEEHLGLVRADLARLDAGGEVQDGQGT
jgi:capsule polysaccharide export protein KpsE/RkpR